MMCASEHEFIYYPIKTISYEFYWVLGAEWFAKKINKPRQLCRGLLSCGPVHDLVCELPRPLNWMKEAAALYRIYGDVLRAIFQKFIVYTLSLIHISEPTRPY